ncbi:hypothetical protein NCC78_00790 [Micromonospora phytophila]|uniref:hypothetical protein n=1 Tax=Micromonospora phytophila TaxID=709888 RepID=UPI002030E7B2|nr:hypothetical protein [Micromonospora phytophila]MCM0673273.1 hypothetical protein [Micromonospora phytophila]
MAQAVLAMVAAVVGAAITAFATIYGPLKSMRRLNVAETERARLVRRDEAVECFIALRSTTRRWLDELERIHEELQSGRRLTVEDFDNRSVSLKSDCLGLRDELAKYWKPVDSNEGSHRLTINFLLLATKRLRQVVLGAGSGDGDASLNRIGEHLMLIRLNRVQLNEFLFRRIEELHGAPTGEYHDQAYLREIRMAVRQYESLNWKGDA